MYPAVFGSLKDYFFSLPMDLMRLVHIYCNGTDGICQIMSRVCKIHKLPTNCLYNELSTNGDAPKSPSFIPERNGNLDSIHSIILNFNNMYATYFGWTTLIPASDYSISKKRNYFNNLRSDMENSLCNEEFIDPIYLVKLPIIKRS